MNHRALIGGELAQGAGKRFAKGALVGFGRWCENSEGLAGQLLVMLLPGASSPDQVNGQVMGQPQQEGPFVPHALEQVRAFGQFSKYLLEQVARVRFVPREIEQKREHALRVFVV